MCIKAWSELPHPIKDCPGRLLGCRKDFLRLDLACRFVKKDEIGERPADVNANAHISASHEPFLSRHHPLN